MARVPAKRWQPRMLLPGGALPACMPETQGCEQLCSVRAAICCRSTKAERLIASHLAHRAPGAPSGQGSPPGAAPLAHARGQWCYQSSSDTSAHDNGRAGSAFVSLQSSASQGSNVTKIQGDSAQGGARMQLAVVDCWQLAKARRLASSTHAAAARLMRGCGCAHVAASSPSEPAQCVCVSATMSNGLSDCNQ